MARCRLFGTEILTVTEFVLNGPNIGISWFFMVLHTIRALSRFNVLTVSFAASVCIVCISQIVLLEMGEEHSLFIL